MCLLVDCDGVHLVAGGRFVDCTIGSPLWPRTALDRSTPAEIRRRIAKIE